MIQRESNNRVLYFDCLRIAATLAVVVLHVCAENWYSMDAATFEWQVYNLGDGLVRWCVPIFVMISGALFLGRDISIEQIHRKYILRILTAYLFWSALYAVVGIDGNSSIKSFIVSVIVGHYHMWFLPMIAGLYLVTPLVRKSICSDSLLKYFLLLALFFAILAPQAIKALEVFSDGLSIVAESLFGDIGFHFCIGFVGYFVLGYFLSNVDLSKRVRMIIYALSILGFVSTIFGTYWLSVHTNGHSDYLYGDFTVNVLLESLGVFVFFKQVGGSVLIEGKAKQVITKLSKYSFGVYLVHPMILEFLDRLFGINTLMCNPIVAVVVVTLLVSICSVVVSSIINHVPFFKKYIV